MVTLKTRSNQHKVVEFLNNKRKLNKEAEFKLINKAVKVYDAK